MVKAIHNLPLSLALSAVIAGCSSGGDLSGELSDASVGMHDEAADVWAEEDPNASGAEPMPPPPAFEPFEINVNQAVTVGAFLLELSVARVAPEPDSWFGDATVEIDFVAKNLSTELHQPLATIPADDLLLEAGDEFYFGDVVSEAVPGLRNGEGTLGWLVDFRDGVVLDDLRSAVVTIGSADQNQVVIPLANPADSTTLADIELDLAFTVSDFREADLHVSSAVVQCSRHSRNELLETGTAMLFMDALLSGVDSGHGEAWRDGHVFVERPDGVSVGPESLIEFVRPNDRLEILLAFELLQPVQGTYVFGVFDKDLGTRTMTFEVP